jgi:hypothetical protein
MNAGERQIIAEKIASTVRVLELLGYQYDVTPPRNERKKGNKSPRVVYVYAGKSRDRAQEDLRLRVYNNASGTTWAYRADGSPIKDIGSVEDLYDWLTAHPLLKLKHKR